jgi:hypothetical protein
LIKIASCQIPRECFFEGISIRDHSVEETFSIFIEKKKSSHIIPDVSISKKTHRQLNYNAKQENFICRLKTEVGDKMSIKY